MTSKDRACKEIRQIIKPGDVINQIGHASWYDFFSKLAYAAIRWHQKRLLGSKSNYYDTHSMLYIDPEYTFSVELPKATVKPLEDYCLSDMSIYRLRNKVLTRDEIDRMFLTSLSMCGENYDVGQLLDIAINNVLKYVGGLRRLKIFDFGEKKKVCSVGVRVVFEKLHQQLNPQANKKWLFRELNLDSWPSDSIINIANYKGTDVEATSPAHFANSDLFGHEFELIAKFKNGVRVG